MRAETLDPNTLERLVPDALDPEDVASADTLRLHLERYAFAARHARPGRLLDLACGVGYGTRLLADRSSGVREALGVDLSPEAVAHARDRYGDARTRYAVGDAMRFTEADGFDTIVSLETVEHLPEPERFLARLADLLRPQGVLVASVPTTPSVDLNPHHLHDFSARSFRRLGARLGLREVDALVQVQRVDLLDTLRPSRFRRENLRQGLPAYYARHPGALLRRIGSVLRVGFANHYLTLAWERGG
jgi:SAM-dependent methyltransferase